MVRGAWFRAHACHPGNRRCLFARGQPRLRAADAAIPLKLVCNTLSWLKDYLVLPDEATAHIESRIAEANRTGGPVDARHLRLCARVYIAYQRTLRDANAADFGDLLLWPVRAMRGNPDYLARWTGRFDAVLADEYQDINHAQ